MLKGAPDWARVWCSGARGVEVMTRTFYEVCVERFREAEQARFPDLAEMLCTLVPLSLVHVECRCGLTGCDGYFYAVNRGCGARSDGERAVLLCAHPLTCQHSAVKHPYTTPEMVTVVGYRGGLAPEVMRAIQRREPFQVVRAMVQHPDDARLARASMN